ncbi:hypothetical protein C9374_002935 [Naegleria lovaniensis]|uniref:60S ribosomal protein L3 n=1 Tax=Naegleria lovaniensis TaxID=51637 RepID=A0AA88GP88_NAELO|nr:uncharacterized protein C9374_002935 [Naegleria lovaniensis]KAG2385786.1 hypothetical protein C9374_002935 [Naegleria lovaniensis]
MSHRKFEAPRHGSLAFLPRKKARRERGRIKAYPKDDQSKKSHMTAFLGYKAGMTHIVREVNKPGSKLHKKECLDAVTIVEAPPMVVVGVVGYKQTPTGLKSIGTVWAKNIGNEFRRVFYKDWCRSKKRAFTKLTKSYLEGAAQEKRTQTLESFKKNADVIRVVAHTQPSKVKSINNKKAHVAEIQINGGNIDEKIKFALANLEKLVPVDAVFAKDEPIDVIAVSKGKGTKGVVSRWGVRRLPRKTHRGLRKVACIGAWHPARVSFSVARAGQKGFFHRVHQNKKIYRLGKSLLTEEGKKSAMTDFDLTEKDINPMGGFVNYGVVENDWVMIKGNVQGPARRVVTLRKTLIPENRWNRSMKEEITLKFIDTTSKIGKGKFQTTAEKNKFLGPRKKQLEQKRLEDEKKLQALKEKRKAETK